MGKKKCSKCGIIKSLNEFHPHKKHGWQSWCKKCQNEAGRKWYKTNQETKREKVRRYREANPEKFPKKIRYYKTKTLEERFWERVEKNGEGECWIWKGAKSQSGYGQIQNSVGDWKKGESHHQAAHRLSWKIHYGEIPDGMLVCHKCDNPPCCNPSHLFLGTHADNCRDKIQKGRDYDKNGQNNPRAKLTVDEVKEIRQLLDSKQYLQKEIALLFDVCQTSISRIGLQETWKLI